MRVAIPRILRAPRVSIPLIAILVTLPSLGVGLFDDDIWQRRFLLDHLNGARSDGWWQMFTVAAPSAIPALVYTGVLPWWTSPHFKLSFFRPLAVATHYLDYAVWPHATWLMHLQNTVWYAVLCLCVFGFYRRALGPGRAASLAAFMYAIDDAHLEAAAWLSARNTILTAMFGVGTLVLLEESSAARSRRHAILAALSLSLAHLSSEGAVGVWAYILGGIAFSKRHARRHSLIAIVPCAIVSLGFVLLTNLLDYRVVGSGAYIDPRVRPVEFAQAVVERMPNLLSAQFGPPAWLSRLAGQAALATALSIGVAVGWLVVLAAGLRFMKWKPELRGLAVGMLGCLLVACAARPEPRLLLFAGLGAHALMAECLIAAWECVARSSWRQHAGAGCAVAWIATLHLALPPVASLTVPEWYRERHRARLAAAEAMEIGPSDAGRTVAILNGPSYFDALSICTYRVELWPPSWRALHILGTSEHPVTLVRPAPQRLLLEAEGGYLSERTSQQARSPDEPFAVGQTISLFGLDVVVAATTSSGRPTRIRLELPPEPEERMRFLNWNAKRQTFERIALPRVGESVRL
jgi:hypothetical protein